MVDNILQDKNDVVTIAVNGNAKKSSDKQLRQAAVQLAVLGVSLDDIDPHNAVKRPLAAVKMSPLAMKLTGKSYVSAKTEKAFADALADGRVVKQAKAVAPAVNAPERIVEVEKIVEVERIVEVEKIVYLNADGTVADGTTVNGQTTSPANTLPVVQQVSNQPNSLPSNVAADIERSVSQFVEHQQQVLNVHEQYMQGPKDYAKTVDNVLTAVSGKQVDGEVPQSVERTLNMYHDFQSQTLRVHEQYLNNQSDNMSTMFSGKVLSNEAPLTKTVHSNSPAQLNVPQQAPVASVTAPTVITQPVVSQATPVTKQVAKPVVQQAVVAKAAVVAAVATVTTPVAPVVDLARIQTVMMEVVADKTGYPTEMLELGMDMEADLGIDSIKRVEILGSVQEIINDLPELNPEDLAELRTLGEIVSYMQSKVAALPVTQATAQVATPVQTASAPVIDLERIQTVMMEVVADKTGYPTEMLELGMDMEADLGIDSIKRVEILGAVQEIIEDLPELNPEDLAELRTLGEIVSYMQEKVQSEVEALPVTQVATSVAVTETPVAAVAIDLDHIQNVMMEVVADKTGYPTEMLELGMDMEADLGIDSIKRVEILGAVQEIIEDLPELNPEDLAELRTLGEIVSYMQSKVAALPTAEIAQTTTSVAVIEAPVATVTIDLDHIQNVMMEVVADKTGYPPEMLELAMDMEADLGIDSIKRVEILGAVQEIIEDLPELNPEDLAELRTLGEIVTYMQSKVAPLPTAEVAQASTSVTVNEAPVAPVAIDLDHIQNVMMEVVADKTGYPPEMLELAMDLEADLGIDSIKRVEILGAVQEIIEDLPELNPEDLAELRTLGEIVSYMQSKVAPVPPTTPTTPPTSPTAKNTTATEQSSTSTSTAIADPAPSAVVALQALSSVTKIVQDFSALGKDQAQANALIVDDGSGAAVALSSKLLKQGWQVTVLKPNWLVESSKKTFNKAVNLVDIGSNDHTVDEEQVKQLLEQHAQLDAVIYLQAKNTVNSIDNIEYAEAAKQGLMLAFVLAKLCQVKSAKVARASFVVVTRQGGTLGFTNTGSTGEQNVKADLHADLVQGGLGGLVKTLSHEWRAVSDNKGDINSDTNLGVFCRVIDLSVKLAADKAATIICDELLDINTSLIEVAHDTDNLSHDLGKRLTLVGVKTDSYALEQRVTLDNDAFGNVKSIDSNSVFLVSGGAKGVTAHCVIEIAKQHQASFILLGRSPLLESEEESEADNSEDTGAEPSWANGHQDEVALKKAAMQVLIASGEKPTPVKVTQFVRPILANREIVQTLNAIKAAGGHAQYVAADVTDSQSVSDAVAPALTALAEITQAKAPLVITGIIHGAGVLADKFIEQKTLAEFDAVYRTKIDGLLSLMAVCQPEHIKHLVLFSSAAGFYGNPGQSDYSIANDILNKTAYRFKAQHPNAQVLSFNWGPWDGGMVTPELKRMFNARGVYIIPLDAGAKLLVSELNANTNRCAQILVGNDLSKSPETETEVEQESSLKKSQVSRLSARVIKTLQATNNPFLADHVIGDDQVLPTVCAIAWMSDAAQSVYSEYDYQGINDYKLFKGVTFDKATLAKKESKDYFVDMNTQVIDDGNTLLVDSKISSINDAGKIVFHYSGQVVLVAKATQPLIKVDSSVENLVVSELADKLTSTTASEAKALYQNGTLFHGESLQGISHVIECDEQGLLLACKVPQVAQRKQGDFVIPENLLSNTHNIFANDLAYQAMLVWVKRELGLGSLPSSTQAWHVYGQVELGQTFYLQLNVVSSSGKGGKRGKLVADINFISENGLLLAEMKSTKVTASDSLNEMFLPAVSVTKADNSNDDAVVEKAEGMAK